MIRIKLTILCILVMLTGCTTLNQFAVYGDNDKPVRFKGLKNLVEKNSHVNVIFVHGMTGYACPKEDECDPKHAINVLKRKLPKYKDDGFESFLIRHNGEIVGRMRVDKTKTASSEQSVNYYTIDWSDVVGWKKFHLQEDNGGVASKHRLTLMNNGKNMLLNRGFADASLYMGKYKKAIQHPIRQALTMVAERSSGKSYTNAIITFSLGSSIVFDTLATMQDTGTSYERVAAHEITENSKLFFMLANQLPLIALSDIPADSLSDGQTSTSAQYMNGLQKFINSASAKQVADEPWIVAVSDPNDLLSYPVLKNMRQLYPNTFVTVLTSVQTTGYWIPFVGTVTNPLNAHLGYGADETTLDLLFNGYALK